MKKIILYITTIFAALSLPAGCEKLPCRDCEEQEGLRRVTLHVGGGAGTKVTGVTAEQEAAVRKCALYVFSSSDGRLVGSWSGTGGVFTVYLLDDKYDFVAVANKDNLPAGDVTRRALEGTPAPLAENAPGSFVMTGSLTNHEVFADEKLTVEVQRLVAKVSYVIRQRLEGSFAGHPFVVDDIYMTNVAADGDLGATKAVSGKWYNPMLFDPQTAAGYDYPIEMLRSGVTAEMAPGDTLASGDVFYIYPNSAEDNHSKTEWTPRCTRLVVAAHLDGIPVYYAATIPVVLPNRHYHIDMTIKSRGSDHPEDLLDELALQVTVQCWENGGNINGVFM